MKDRRSSGSFSAPSFRRVIDEYPRATMSETSYFLVTGAITPASPSFSNQICTHGSSSVHRRLRNVSAASCNASAMSMQV